MTVLLVIVMFSVFLIIDFLHEKKKERKLSLAQDATDGSWRYPHDVGIAKNHIWLRPEQDCHVTVGIDHFLGSLLGVPDAIILPKEGKYLRASSQDIGIQKDGKSLHLSIPISGRVTAVNTDLLKNPRGVGQDPYGAGWCLKLLPDNPVIRNAFQTPMSLRWMRDQFEKAKEFLVHRYPNRSNLEPVFMQDGGLTIDGALGSFDGDVWKEFEEEFLSLDDAGVSVKREDLS